MGDDPKIITPGQLQKALEKQSQLAKMAVRKPLGKLLVEMGFTTYDGYLGALSKHFNMAIVSLRGFFSFNLPAKSSRESLCPKASNRGPGRLFQNDQARPR